MADHYQSTTRGQFSMDECFSSFNTDDMFDEITSSASMPIFNQPKISHLELTIIYDNDAGEDLEASKMSICENGSFQSSRNTTLLKRLNDFVSPYKFDLGQQEFEEKLQSVLDDVEVLRKSDTLCITHYRQEKSPDDMETLMSKIQDIMRTIDTLVYVISVTLTGEQSRMYYSHRHLDYFLAGCRNVKGFCDENGEMHFTYYERQPNQRERIEEHLRIVREQEVVDHEIRLTHDSDRVVLELCADLTCTPTQIKVNNDAVQISGFSEDVLTENLKIRKILEENSAEIRTLERSKRTLLREEIVQKIISDEICKQIPQGKSVKWRVVHGHLEVAGRIKNAVVETMDFIQAFFYSFDIFCGKRMFGLKKYDTMKRYLKANFSRKFILTERADYTLNITCTKDIAENVEIIVQKCSLQDKFMEMPTLESALLLKMKESLEQEGLDIEIEVNENHEQTNKLRVRGTEEAHVRLEALRQDIVTQNYFILMDDSLQKLQRMEHEPREGLFRYKTTKVELNISIKLGRLENEQADVIVSTSPSSLNLAKAWSYTVAGALHRARGNVQEPFNTSNTEYQPGTVKEGVSGGDLKCKEVYHVVVSNYDSSDGGTKSKMLLWSVVTECLEKASKKGHNTIAFPSIGTGSKRYPYEIACDVIYEAIVEFAFSERHTSLKTVTIVLKYQKDFEIFKTIREKRLKELKEGKKSWICNTCLVVASSKEQLTCFDKYTCDIIENETELKTSQIVRQRD